MRDNAGISAMTFLFVVPILFVVVCFIIDFSIIFKEKNKLKDNMEQVIALYEDENTINENDRQRNILKYADANNFKANYTVEENGDVKFTLTKKIELKTPVGTHILGNPYSLELIKVKSKE